MFPGWGEIFQSVHDFYRMLQEMSDKLHLGDVREKNEKRVKNFIYRKERGSYIFINRKSTQVSRVRRAATKAGHWKTKARRIQRGKPIC